MLAAQTRSVAESATFAGTNWLLTDVEDIYDGLPEDASIRLLASYTGGRHGDPSIQHILYDLKASSLFNSTGGGILEADPRSPKSIGGQATVHPNGHRVHGFQFPAGIGGTACLHVHGACRFLFRRSDNVRRDGGQGQSGPRDRPAIFRRDDDCREDRPRRGGCPTRHGGRRDRLHLRAVHIRARDRAGGIGSDCFVRRSLPVRLRAAPDRPGLDRSVKPRRLTAFHH